MTELPEDRISFDELVARLERMLVEAGAEPEISAILARNCASCERDGTLSHGIFRMKGYLHSLRTGWASGTARASVERVGAGFIRVNGMNGFTQPAMLAAQPEIDAAIAEAGVALVAVRDAHHTTTLWSDLEPLAEQGYVALGMIASGVLMVQPRGAHARTFSTNPVGFATPVEGAPPIVFDFSTSAISGGDLALHAREGRTVPIGIGVDGEGNDTEDPQAILDGGNLLPFGGPSWHKGMLLGMMIEMMAAGIGGGQFSFEHDAEKASAPGGAMTFRNAQLFIVIDPTRGGNEQYGQRIAAFADMMRDAGVDRLPGDKRYRQREIAEREGIPVTELMRELFAEEA